jgi:hypothetical protein
MRISDFYVLQMATLKRGDECFAAGYFPVYDNGMVRNI